MEKDLIKYLSKMGSYVLFCINLILAAILLALVIVFISY